MKTPDLMPSHKAQLPRSSHVLSHDFGFTATTGHLLPVFHTIMNPGDKINLGFDFNLRTMELESAAFADLVTHVEYFFVPMQLLYQPFDNVIYDVQDQFSSNFSYESKAVLPLLDMSTVYTRLYNQRSAPFLVYPETNTPIESCGQNSIRLFDMLGLNPIPIAVGTTNPQTSTAYYMPNIFPYQLLAYNCIYEYFYRMDSREIFRSDLFNFDKYYNTPLVQYFEKDIYSLKYRPLRNDYFTDVKVSPIVDVLNLNDKTQLDVANQWLSRSDFTVLSGITQPVLRSGTVGSNSGLNNSDYSPLDYVNFNPSDSIQTNFGFTLASRNISNGSLVNGMDINTANIRAMFANEKLWSITGRAKKNYDDQTLAHFGFSVPHDVKHEITCFGHDEGKIHIGEVISTANTELSPLGEIAGKGYGQMSSKRHSFTAPCHGVVMAIFSVECVHNYEAGLLKANAVASKYDFYIPEYDHLGMQPLFNYESSDLVGDSNAGNIIGWQYRYEHWKRRYNRTSGAFRNTSGTLKSWIPTYQRYLGDVSTGAIGKDSDSANLPSYDAFLNFPTDVNQIFLAQYQGIWSTAYEGNYDWAKIYDFDPFVVNSHIDAVLVSTMSDYSLPRLDA